MSEAVPMLEAHDLHKSFSSGERSVDVLRGVDLRIEPGEMVAIVGASGTGKSTLLHVLGTLDRPSRGGLRFEGADVLSLSDEETTRLRNHKIGFVFQFHHLLPEFTAAENVAMPLWISRVSHAVALDKAHGLLGRLGLKERCDHRPTQLSGGEQQRVAIARALVCEPRLVLADEPTGNLDTRKSHELVDLMREMHDGQGLTSVIVTHSEDIARVCDRVLRMEDGRLS